MGASKEPKIDKLEKVKQKSTKTYFGHIFVSYAQVLSKPKFGQIFTMFLNIHVLL
jgi:hypothetical protein